MNKIKVIDLLNMISKGEELPEKILYSDKIWYWDIEENDYVEDYKRLFNYYLEECLISNLNDEVEIIEEDKKIEKLNYNNNDEFDIEGFTFDFEQKMQIVDKINEIIDHINKGDN